MPEGPLADSQVPTGTRKNAVTYTKRIAEAYANDGRGKDAADAYLAAAGSEPTVNALDLKNY